MSFSTVVRCEEFNLFEQLLRIVIAARLESY